MDETASRARRAGTWALALAAVASWLLFSGLNFWMGELNQDEGWYLYAAGQIREGRLPYRDFAFTQPPLMPLVYALGYGWVERHGVAGGRALTWAFGAAGLLCASWLARRAAPRGARGMAGGLCFVLAGVNLYQSYFSAVVKTYSLAGAFLAAGLLSLSFAGPRRALRAAGCAGFLLACAAATRITLGVTLPLGLAYLWLVRRRLRAWAWLDFAIGGGVGLALTFLAFMALGGEGFRFGIFEYHALRESGSLASQWVYKIGCMSRLVQAYYPAAALLLLVAAARLCGGRCAAAKPQAEEGGAPPGFGVFLWVGVALMAAAHLAAPFPYDDYQVPVYPILCAVLAATAVRRWTEAEERHSAAPSPGARDARRLAALAGVWLLCGLHAFASPVAQGWFVAGRDRIWWRLRGQSPVAQLREVGRSLRDLAAQEGTDVLLTQDVYLAVEARLAVPRGLEMGPFSYYPDWPRERAERVGVVNRGMLMEMLETADAPVAAFSGYSLSIRSPEVEEADEEDRLAFRRIVEGRYERVAVVPDFGQAATTLEIWRLKRGGKDAAQ